jgi:hypothetical protein
MESRLWTLQSWPYAKAMQLLHSENLRGKGMKALAEGLPMESRLWTLQSWQSASGMKTFEATAKHFNSKNWWQRIVSTLPEEVFGYVCDEFTQVPKGETREVLEFTLSIVQLTKAIRIARTTFERYKK